VAVIGDHEALEGEAAVTVRLADGSSHLGVGSWMAAGDPASSSSFPF
jgi:hypothetical protein